MRRRCRYFCSYLQQPCSAPRLDLIQDKRSLLPEVVAGQALANAVERYATIQIDSHPMQKQDVPKQEPHENAGIQLRKRLLPGFYSCSIVPIKGNEDSFINA